MPLVTQTYFKRSDMFGQPRRCFSKSFETTINGLYIAHIKLVLQQIQKCSVNPTLRTNINQLLLNLKLLEETTRYDEWKMALLLHSVQLCCYYIAFSTRIKLATLKKEFILFV